MHSTRTTSLKAQAVMIRSALIVAALSVLVLMAARPAWAQTQTVLWNFCSAIGCPDGENPGSGLTSDGAGNFYGTTIYGGANSGGDRV